MRLLLIAMLAAGCLVAVPSVAAADTSSGRPGRLLTAQVTGGHLDPCAPGGIASPVRGLPCWQAVLQGGVLYAGRSSGSRRGVQRVTLTRRIYRTWLPTDPMALSIERSITRRLSARARWVSFPRWSEVTSTGFGYHAVIETVAWRSASGRVLGVRSHAVDRFVCQTGFPCTTGPQWIWLGDPD